MTTAYTSLLGLALPVTGELSGTWGDTVNNSITSLLDTSVAGTTNVSTDGDVTLTTTTGAANTARQAILLFSGARTALRTVTAPAQSKIYTVINATTGGYAVKLVGAGPTTGLTIPNGASATVAWNGSDFVEIGTSSIGNLTVNGNLTVTGNTTLGDAITDTLNVGNGSLIKDSAGNVGVGVSPSAWATSKAIQFGNRASVFSFNNLTADVGNNVYFNGSDYKYIESTYATFYRQNSGAHTWYTAPSGTAGATATFTQAMTLDASGNLGIGTTSIDSKLHVVSGSGSNLAQLRIGYNGTSVNYYDANTHYFRDGSGPTDRMVLNSSGNLGLGVTPSAWGGNYKALQFASGAISSYQTNAMDLYGNAYDSGAGAWKYLNSSIGATRLASTNGQFQFYNAPVGTAGNAITFTQAMTLDADGDLGVGTTSPSERLHIFKSTYPIFKIESTSYNSTMGIDTGNGNLVITNASNAAMAFSTNNTERARITSSGNLLVGGATSDPEAYPTRLAFKGSLAGTGIYSFNQSAGADSAYVAKVSNTSCYLIYFDYNGSNVGSITTNGTTTSYNVTSDYRLKENVAPMTGALETIVQLKPCTYTWKTNGESGQGFIAHELQSVIPEAVYGTKDAVKEDGTPIYQGIDTSHLIPLLTTAIQEQQAIIESLKARLDAANL